MPVQTALSASDRQFLERLNHEGEQTVQDLCRLLGVTATAVRQRLSRLEAAGFVRRQLERYGRGRPRSTFIVSESGLRQLGDNYSELAVVLWDVIDGIEDGSIRDAAISRVRSTMAGRLAGTVTAVDLPQRLTQLRDALAARGYDVELNPRQEADALPVLREYNCPYHSLSERDKSICDFEQQLFSEVLGADVALTTCCRDGHPHCEFEVKAAAHS